MRLLTKQSRQDMRSAWIGDNPTEKYKDIEILSITKIIDNKERITLTIWRGTAGNPYINYWLRTAQDKDRYILEAKRQADNRENYYKEHPKANGKVQTEAAKTALHIKNILKREYPSVKFSVTSDNFANGNSVDIRWIDGIPTKDIESFSHQFQYGNFDGMTDCYNYDNKHGYNQAKYVHCSREISQEKRDTIQEQLAKLMNIANQGYSVIPKDYQVNVRGYAYDAPLNALVYQISVDFDFTKGFTGVRYKKQDGHEIKNMFELY